MDSTLLYIAIGGLVLVIVGVAVAVPMLSKKRGSASASPGEDKQARRPSKEAPASPTGGPMAIYFGSQTGTAECFAKTIQKEAKKKGFAAVVHDLESFDPEQLKAQPLAIFLVATYGEGDPTDNAMAFAKWLKDADGEIPASYLQGVNYFVFALGDTQYEHFNAMGKLTDKRLADMGASRLEEVFLGDASGALEDDFDKWREGMWRAVMNKFNPEASSNGQVDDSSSRGGAPAVPELPFKLAFVEAEAINNYGSNGHHHSSNGSIDNGAALTRALSTDNGEVNTSTKFYFTSATVPIKTNKELRQPADGGSTKHIELHLPETGLTYNTADNLGVLPENDSDVVQALAASQGYDLDRFFVFEQGKALFPTPTTVREALTYYVDLKGIPRRSTLSQLAAFARNPKDVERLMRLASKEGRQEFREVVEAHGRSLFELVTEVFPSVQIPLDHFINLAPRLQPRYYTISSSSKAHPDSIHITVAVTRTDLPDGRVHTGVCSSYLAKTSTSTVRCFVRASSFRLPSDPSVPIIMVGPGTGVAPMRALLQERRHQRVVEKKTVGETLLFFGCRRRDHDFLYEEELMSYTRDGTLTDLQLAFSREGVQKVYVQHLINKPETAARLWQLLDKQGAHVYVCGGTKMGTDVLQAFGTVAKAVGNLDDKTAMEYIKSLQNQGRYVQELWSA